MRILLSCLQDLRQHAIPAYRFWATYFRNGIVEAGHEFTEVPNVDWAEGCTAKSKDELKVWRDAIWTRTLEWVRSELVSGRRIDLFLSYLFPQQIEPSAIAEIKKLGIPCVNFFCDNIREFRRVPREFRCFDLHWVPEYEALPIYKRESLKTCFAPMPCWVPKEARSPEVAENRQVTFIGSSDNLRRALFARALSLGAPLKIAGAGWLENAPTNVTSKQDRSIASIVRNQAKILRNQGLGQWLRRTIQRITPPSGNTIPPSSLLPPVGDHDYVDLIRESMITLGVNRVPTFRRSPRNPLTYSRLRDIEAPMMGACYLTEWTEGLTHFYDVGAEIETYRKAEEMVGKIDMLSNDKHKRLSLRAAGQRRALNDLTIGKSVKRICSALELSAH
jgi:hypothetical protein